MTPSIQSLLSEFDSLNSGRLVRVKARPNAHIPFMFSYRAKSPAIESRIGELADQIAAHYFANSLRFAADYARSNHHPQIQNTKTPTPKNHAHILPPL